MIPRVISSFFLCALVASAKETTIDDSLASSIAAPTVRSAAASSGSLERLMNAFLRAYAGDNPAWRTQVTTSGITSSSPLSSGAQRGQTKQGVWFSFFPKTTDMLSAEDRRKVMRDRRFTAFLGQMREVADGAVPPIPDALLNAAKDDAPAEVPAMVPRAELMATLLAGRRPPPAPIIFEISPEEILLPGPMVITHQSALTPTRKLGKPENAP